MRKLNARCGDLFLRRQLNIAVARYTILGLKISKPIFAMESMSAFPKTTWSA